MQGTAVRPRGDVSDVDSWPCPSGEAIRAAREAAGWTIVEAVRKLKQRADRPLPEVESLVRSWKRWERDTVPSRAYRHMLADLLRLGPAHDGPGPAPMEEVAHVFPGQAAVADEVRTAASAATTIDVLAVRGLGILALNDSLLRPVLGPTRATSLRLRVLLLRPGSDAAKRRAREIDEPAESFSAGIVLAEARLHDLARLPYVDVEAYEYDTLPVWRMIRLDSTLYVSSFDSAWEGHESPVYRIRPSQSRLLHQGFGRMFDELCRCSTRIA